MDGRGTTMKFQRGHRFRVCERLVSLLLKPLDVKFADMPPLLR
jgi:hypothetical protein